MNKVVIIDDEPLARLIVMEYLQDVKNIEVVAECNDGFEGMKAIAQHQPSLIFLDIQMPKINGFEMLELLPSPPAVIFTTAFDEYAIRAFEANAIDYLLKPFSKERFHQALEKWNSKSIGKEQIQHFIENTVKQPEERNRIVVKKGSDIRILPVEDVYFIEAYDDYVKIFLKEGYYLKKKTMNYYEQVLDASTFVRVHRSFIINLNHLTKIEALEKNSYLAILKNDTRIPISRNSYARLKGVLGL
jgi:two-component system LytT family response regulator